MAHFIGRVKGDRGECSRLGTKESRIIAEVNGWNTGCKVEIHHNPETNRDKVLIYRTYGSNGKRPNLLVMTYEE